MLECPLFLSLSSLRVIHTCTLIGDCHMWCGRSRGGGCGWLRGWWNPLCACAWDRSHGKMSSPARCCGVIHLNGTVGPSEVREAEAFDLRGADLSTTKNLGYLGPNWLHWSLTSTTSVLTVICLPRGLSIFLRLQPGGTLQPPMLSLGRSVHWYTQRPLHSECHLQPNQHGVWVSLAGRWGSWNKGTTWVTTVLQGYILWHPISARGHDTYLHW